jgi:hypothetical protein
VVSVQVHPEFDLAVMRAYLDALAPQGRGEGIRLGAARPTPVATMLLQRFIDSVPG